MIINLSSSVFSVSEPQLVSTTATTLSVQGQFYSPSNMLCIRIGQAYLKRWQTEHILVVCYQFRNLLDAHTELIKFVKDDVSDDFAASQTSHVLWMLSQLSGEIADLLYHLTNEPWWPQRGQMFIQLTTQAETLASYHLAPTDTSRNERIEEIESDTKFFNILLRPLLDDLVEALHAAHADCSVWSHMMRGDVDAERIFERPLRSRVVGSGLRAVRPVCEVGASTYCGCTTCMGQRPILCRWV